MSGNMQIHKCNMTFLRVNSQNPYERKQRNGSKPEHLKRNMRMYNYKKQ